MPAKSKQQQKFMGIVRAIQKGDEPASKFSKDAQDAADDMKKKDVEKFASTKHKGLPKKVEQYLRQQIRKSVEEIIEEDWFKRLSSNDQKKYLKDHPNSKKAKQVKANKSKVKNTLLKGLKSGGLSVYSYGSMINQALDQIGDYPDLKKKIDTYGNNVPSSKGKSEAQYQKEIDKYNAEGEKIKKDIAKTLKKEVKEDYVETCGYTQSADGKKLKTPGATGEEDRHLKEVRGVPNKMRAGFKKLKNKEGLSQEERNELYKAYKGIVELLTYGNFYDNKKPNKRRKELSELTFDINYALVGSKRLGSYQGRFEKIFKKFLNMINTQIKREEKGLKTDYRKAMRASKLDDVKNIFKNMTKYARTQKGIEKGTNEGFGSDEFLTKTEKKKFEKERLENAEVLGYELTGTKDIKESTIQEQTVTPINKIKGIKNLVKKDLVSYRGTGAGGNFEISIRNKKVPGYPPSFALLQKDEKKYRDIRSKQFKIKPVAKYFIKGSDLNQLKKFGNVGFLATNRRESVFAVRQDKIKNGERFSKKPNFDYDPEKGKSRIKKVNEAMNPRAVKKMRDEFEKTGQLPPHLKKFALDLKILKKKHKVKNIVVPGLEWMSDMKEQSVNEKKKMFPPKKMTPKQAKEYKKFIGYAKMGVEYQIDMSLFESINEARLDPKQTIQQLGGNRFLYMVGAKNLAIDKPRNELHMKIMRNAKGVSHVVVRLTSLDLYDMKFLSIRAGKIRVKAKEKGVYGDQLATFFKKHTGLNTRL